LVKGFTIKGIVVDYFSESLQVMRYIYILCSNFTLCNEDLRNDLNFYSKENTTFKNLQNINRWRTDKKELIEMMFYSVCFDNLKMNYHPLKITNKYLFLIF